MAVLLVGIGGFLGAVARYLIAKTIAEKMRTVFPAGTFVVNLSGAFLFGLLTAFLPETASWRSLLVTGFLGAYTTFSTFMLESVYLLQDGEMGRAFWYNLLSLLLGVLLAALGFQAGTFFARGG